MANYATLKAAIQQVIKTNANNEITGAILQSSLLSMITELGSGYLFMGVASPSTNPGTPDANVFYIASSAGTYTNFGGITLSDGEVGILSYNGSWTKSTSGFASDVISKKISDRLLGLSFNDLTTVGYYDSSGTLVVNQNLRSTKIDIPAGTKQILTHVLSGPNNFETIIFFDSGNNVVDYFYNASSFYAYPIKPSYASVAFNAYKINETFEAIFMAEPNLETRKTEDPNINKYIKELYLENVPNVDIYIYVLTTTGQIIITDAFNTSTGRLANGTYNAATGLITITEANNSGLKGFAVWDKTQPLPAANITTKQAKIIKEQTLLAYNPYIASLVYNGQVDVKLAQKVDYADFRFYETNFALGVLRETSITVNQNIDITAALRLATTPVIGVDMKPWRATTRPIILVYNGSTIVVNQTMPNSYVETDDGWYYLQDTITLPATWTRAVLQIRTASGETTQYRNIRISNSNANNRYAGDLIAPFAGGLVPALAQVAYGVNYGKKLVCLGDSITYQHLWQPYLVQRNGVICLHSDSYPGINYPLALGGAHVLPVYTNPEQWTPSDGPASGNKKGTSIYYMADYVHDCNPDVIIVFGGTNDVSFIGNLGTINDEPYTGAEVPYENINQVTFYGAYKGMLYKLTTQNPNAKIYAMTVMYPWYRNPSDGVAYFAEKKALINNAIRECCALYSVEVIDLCYDSGINLFNASVMYNADSSDAAWQGASARVHPNQTGAEMMARLIGRMLK